MEEIFDVLLDGVLDTLKLIPFLFVTFLLLEFVEHKFNKKSKKLLTNTKKFGPIVGGLLGGLPQCGFSAMAANLFSSRVITMGTLIAIFLSTSDEMLPIMLSEQVDVLTIARLIGFKIIIGMLVGLVVDLFIRKTEKNDHIHELCESDHCHCEKGILKSSVVHTLKTALFILIANLAIGLIIFFVGEESIKNLMLSNNILTYFAASLIGLIPNCAGSVILTEVYLSELISLGNLMAGLLTGSGIGILLLFKSNKDLKENLKILSIIYFVGVLIGVIIDILI